MVEIHPDKGRHTGSEAGLALLVTRRVTFAAAHVLRRPDWDAERNQAVFGACARDHGHNYVLEVSVSGPVDPETGEQPRHKAGELVLELGSHAHRVTSTELFSDSTRRRRWS